MFSPLVTFIGAIVIKFCFIDDPGNEPGHFIYERYITDLWLEVYMIALGFSFIEERKKTSNPFYKTLPAAFIAIALVCVILVFALPKFKISSDLFRLGFHSVSAQSYL